MNNNNEDVLLSICIPTYNRCDYLDKALKSIVDQDSFDQRVEVVISDNCSTDYTKETVSKYQLLHNNIYYHCNDINKFDENFNTALSFGTGEYLKLMNDSILMHPGVIKRLLIYIEKYRDKKPVMFFYNNNERHSNKTITCYNINQFVDTTSYYIGWVANYGAWKAQFEKIENKIRYSLLRFLQIDWSLKMIENRKTMIIFSDWIESQPLKTKGGYNFFEVHVENYLLLLKPYLNNGSLSYSVFRKEKNRLLRYFLSRWIYMILIRKEDMYHFKTTNWKRIFWRNYKSYPLVYIVFCKQILNYIYNLIKEKI